MRSPPGEPIDPYIIRHLEREVVFTRRHVGSKEEVRSSTLMEPGFSDDTPSKTLGLMKY
jgi:hypothetical protein